MGYNIEALKAFNEQVRNVFVPSGVNVRPDEWDVVSRIEKMHSTYSLEELNDMVLKHDAVGNTNEAQLTHVEGGLFTDCCLERPVMNLTLTPTRSLANMLPVVRRNTQVSKYAFLTEIEEPSGPLPEEPCDPAQPVGNIGACFMETRKGRMSHRTNTLELDRIIQKYCEGLTDDLFVVGDTRGVSSLMPANANQNISLMAQAAVRRQFQLVGRALQRKTLRQFWSGDPDNAAVNTNAERQFWGMENLIADDYDTKAWVTGTDCARLNSDIKDFEDTCIGAANATSGVGLYYYMQELEDTLTQKASYHGHTNVEWVYVMHPTSWSSIVKYLPCEMLSGNCAQPLVGNTPLAGNVQLNINDMGIATVRQQLQQSMRIDVNGRSYRVILDDSMPVTRAGTAPNVTHTSDIYFIPLTVDGQRVLFWDVADYRAVARALQPLPGGLGAMRGWHEGGMFLSVVDQENYCFFVTTKMEGGLVMLAPHLAGRINNVVSCNLQQKPLAFD